MEGLEDQHADRWEPGHDAEREWSGPESTLCDPDALEGMPARFRLVGFHAP